jgi:threonylcarbamoyladenosine tRNA methylthiotransferase MtaB
MAKILKSPAVALDSLGCKLNQAEIQHLGQELVQAGFRLVESPHEADIYILNTCTVTHVADRKSRHLLRLARRRNPTARLIAIGCYAHRTPRELAAITGVDLVLGNDRKMSLLKLLDKAGGLKNKVPAVSLNVRESGRRTRAFLKVQDGCRNFCAYCIVPFVRTRELSVSVEDIVAQVKEKVADDFREVVLTGTEIGAYRYDGIDLAVLIERILEESSVPRLRLSSLQPHYISPRLIALWKDPRLCPHFHLSLQSGSDTVLHSMKRRYTIGDYRRAVSLIRASVPDVAITTDVIVGFPGETDAEFQETLEFCREMRFARIHVFPFSPRPGTAAATMTGQIPASVKKERSRQMLALSRESSKYFLTQFLGRTLEVLWEQSSAGVWSGLTGNYIRIYARSRDDLGNRLLPVKLVKLYRDGIWGEV